jgi:beta-lactamase superfamily II metal-dependent hydrolase
MINQVEMVFWDVQHGHATYIKSPNGRHIVIDLGTGQYSNNNKTFSPLKHLKNNYGVTQLDYVVITHPHLDHIDDILQFDSLSPKVLWRPTSISNQEVMKNVRPNDWEKFNKYCEINNTYNGSIPDNDYNNIENPNNWGGLQITGFNVSNVNHSNYNNFSQITIFEYEGIKIIIPGDNENESFDELLKNYHFQTKIINADILLAPHHGRDSGYSTNFINRVKPKLTIVSDGKKVDTSANTRYSQISSGWTVHKRSGGSGTRKCLSTNNDGYIVVKFGTDIDGSRFLYVEGV